MNIPDFRHFGAGLANDAANQLIGDGHLVGLVGAGRAALPSEQGQRYKMTTSSYFLKYILIKYVLS